MCNIWECFVDLKKIFFFYCMVNRLQDISGQLEVFPAFLFNT